MTTSTPSTTGTGPTWAPAGDVQCLDHEWADDDHDGGAQLHVCGLVTDHDGDCLCITCERPFTGALISTAINGISSRTHDMLGRPLPETAHA